MLSMKTVFEILGACHIEEVRSEIPPITSLRASEGGNPAPVVCDWLIGTSVVC